MKKEITVLYPDDNNNIKLLILLCIIGHYVPYGHTISEILLTLSSELNLGYTLDKEPIDFILNLVEKDFPEISQANLNTFDLMEDCYI